MTYFVFVDFENVQKVDLALRLRWGGDPVRPA